jgi:hypothetical protein
MAIYVKFAEEQKPRSINDFLIKFYTQRPSFEQVYAAFTYNDKECTLIQCDKIRRSFDDLLELVKTYYPSTTEKILISKLLKLKIDGYHSIFLTNCSGMYRVRISYFTTKTNQRSFQSIIGVNQYNSKNSWKELLEMIGITTEEQYLEYIK